MPHLKNAIEGIQRQTYRNFELIIQDGGSTDGTLEYLTSIKGLPKIEIASQPDSGIGQAYNRGIVRSNGDFLCLAASDERLFDNALKTGISWFNENPLAASIYGSVSLVDKEGRECSRFLPSPFDFLKFMNCELFPTTAGLLNRKIIGEDLYYDESLKTCPDYDFWLRLGSRFSSKELINRHELFATALCDRTSMSFRAEACEQFCKDKVFILDRFLSRQNHRDLEGMRNKAKAGIFVWGVKSVMQLEGVTPLAIQLCEASEAFSKIDDAPPHHTQIIKNALTLKRLVGSSPRLLKLAIILIFGKKIPYRIKGSKNPWGYTTQAVFNKAYIPLKESYWVKIRMRVSSGAIGVCLMNGKTIEREKIFPISQNEIVTYFPIHNHSEISIIFRNGGIPHSVAEINEVSLLAR